MTERLNGYSKRMGIMQREQKGIMKFGFQIVQPDTSQYLTRILTAWCGKGWLRKTTYYVSFDNVKIKFL